MDEDKLEQARKNARIYSIISLSIMAFILIAILTAALIYKYQHTFTVEKWLQDPDNRRKIVGDLLKKHDLMAMTEEEIISLLGEEDSYANTKTSFKMSKSYFPPESTLVYYLGVDYIDDMWLIISLDKGIVSHYCIDVT